MLGTECVGYNRARQHNFLVDAMDGIRSNCRSLAPWLAILLALSPWAAARTGGQDDPKQDEQPTTQGADRQLQPAQPASPKSPTSIPADTPAAQQVQQAAKKPPPAPTAATDLTSPHEPSPSPAHQPPPEVPQQAGAAPKEQAAAAQTSGPDAPSGFRLMTLSNNALLSRVSLADQATRTIDLQYYIFANDATGRLLALHLLQAADRGVHVRILLDDLNLADEDRLFAALDSHDNIEVKLFNPFASASPGPLSKMAQLVLQFRKLNRRMHNKSFIVDNQEAVIGGRNIGDGYFDAKADNNFRDLDLLAIGPVVPKATQVFESYWNSDAAKPMAQYAKSSSDPVQDLPVLRAALEKDARTFDQSAYKQVANDDLPNGASADRPGNWFWGPATLLADDPAKIDADRTRKDLRISPQVKSLIRGAQKEVLMVSPYFVPSPKDDEDFTALAQRGVDFRVLTNSLASTDEVAAFEGYSDHRRVLLKGGVKLYELQPAPGGGDAPSTDVGRSSGQSLHAKTFVVDRRYVFIGSMNMDQRSKLLNTEMGVVVDSPALAQAVAVFFRDATAPVNAYRLTFDAEDGPGLHWDFASKGQPVSESHDPEASLRRHVVLLVLKLLPIDGLL